MALGLLKSLCNHTWWDITGYLPRTRCLTIMCFCLLVIWRRLHVLAHIRAAVHVSTNMPQAYLHVGSLASGIFAYLQAQPFVPVIVFHSQSIYFNPNMSFRPRIFSILCQGIWVIHFHVYFMCQMPHDCSQHERSHKMCLISC